MVHHVVEFFSRLQQDGAEYDRGVENPIQTSYGFIPTQPIMGWALLIVTQRGNMKNVWILKYMKTKPDDDIPWLQC